MIFFTRLPEDYREASRIDLQNDKKSAALINGSAVLTAALLFVPVAFFVPLSTLLSWDEPGSVLLKSGILLLCVLIYLSLHELTHALAMLIACRGSQKPKIRFSGLYVYAGSECFFGKKAFLFIGLLPLVLFGSLLAVLNSLVTTGWFYVVYLIQIVNIAGSIGDLFTAILLHRLPRDTLIQDPGSSIRFYVRNNPSSKGGDHDE